MKLINLFSTLYQKKVFKRIINIFIGLFLTVLLNFLLPLLKIALLPCIAFTCYNFILLMNKSDNDNKWDTITYTIFFSGLIGFGSSYNLLDKTFNYDMTFIGLLSLSICMLIVMTIKLVYIKDLFSNKRSYVIRILVGMPLFIITSILYLNYSYASENIFENNIEIIDTVQKKNDDDKLDFYVYVRFRSKTVRVKITQQQFTQFEKKDVLTIIYKKGYFGFYIIENVEKRKTSSI